MARPSVSPSPWLLEQQLLFFLIVFVWPSHQVKHQIGTKKKQQQMCAQNQNFQHFRMAKPSVSPSPWSLEQQLLFLHCFPMAQPPGEAPDRNQKKKQQQMCFFWFRFFASLVTGPLHQQPFVFSRIVFNGPGIKSRNKTETETYLAKLATRKKKGESCSNMAIS